jgi:exopolyphosphatase/guanosine-5'-triphosphate,3'-diphosphate pyrophosphatase
MPPTHLAAIDVGTNSLHLVVARIAGTDTFDVVAREKEMVRLGSGGGDMKRLDAGAIDRAIATLDRFRRIALIHDAPIRAVATSAVREAENHDEFLRRARDEAGVEVEVVSGVEEARLIHLGVLQAVPVYERPLLLFDVGGGSTEVLLGHRGEVRASRSFKVGAVRLTNRFFPGQRLHPSAVGSCRSFVRSTLAPFAHEVETLGFEVAVGSSGTVQALATMVIAQRGEPEPLSLNCFEMATDEVREVVRRLARASSLGERRSIPGVTDDRADIILAGGLVVEQVIETFGIKSITISDYALREGVLLDTVHRNQGGSLHHLGDVSRNSVLALADMLDEEPHHSAHVARLALELFDATAGLHLLDSGCREYLEAAALLANVGLFISHSKHHLHSYYVIRNSERLVGFTDTEIEMIALVARYHRKSAPKPSHEEFARLDPEDQRTVRVLAGILRVAIGLDRSHEGRVAALRCRRRGRTLTITVEPAGDVDVDLELYAAGSRRDLLEQALDVTVRIVTPKLIPAAQVS